MRGFPDGLLPFEQVLLKTLVVGRPVAGSDDLGKLLEQAGFVVARIGFEEATVDRVEGSGAPVVIVRVDQDAAAGLQAIRDLAGAERPYSLIAAASVETLEDCVESGVDDFFGLEAPERALRAHLALVASRTTAFLERRRADDARKELNANLLALIENTKDYVLFSDRQGSPVFFNTAYAELMRELLGLEMRPGIKPHEMLPDAEGRALWDGFHRRVLGGERFTVDYEYPPGDPDSLFLEVSYNPVLKDGVIIGFSEFTRDVTARRRAEIALQDAHDQLEAKVAARTAELAASNRALHEEIDDRRRAEQALRESEARYRSVFDTAPLAFVLWDRDARIMDWNRHAERLFGWTRAEVLGMPLVDAIVASRHRERAERAIAALLAGDDGESVAGQNTDKSGKRIECEWTTALLYDEGGGVAGAISLGLDVTERNRLQERLRRSEKLEAIGQLAGGIAHDFNNQLVGVMGYADLLGRSLRNPVHKEYADNILSSARRSAELIAQLLAFARKGKYRSAAVDLHAVIAQVVALLEHSIDKRITIVQNLAACGAVTLGDRTQLHSALLNLALNARDAMPQGGNLAFESEVVALDGSCGGAESRGIASGRYVRIRIRDTGVGMDPETKARVFEPFFTTKPGGTGMGLAAVYGTVRGHKGDIQLESEPGRGSTFDVFLPLLEAVSVPSDASSKVRRSSRPSHVVVIDDESTVRALTEEMLRALGHRVTAFDGGEEAVAWFEANWSDVDVAIIDMVMPKLDGPAVLEALRGINPDVKAVFSSGYSVEAPAREVMIGGVRGVLQKPYDLTELARVLGDLLSEPPDP